MPGVVIIITVSDTGHMKVDVRGQKISVYGVKAALDAAKELVDQGTYDQE